MSIEFKKTKDTLRPKLVKLEPRYWGSARCVVLCDSEIHYPMIANYYKDVDVTYWADTDGDVIDNVTHFFEIPKTI